MINLMPEEVKESILFARRNVLLVQYCILAGLVGLALITTMFFGLSLMSSDESKINDAISEREAVLAILKNDETEAENLSKQITTISSLLNRELPYSTIVTQIGSLIPDGSTLQNLSLNQVIKEEPLRLVVNVDTQAKAAVVQQNFEQSPIFGGADIQSIVPGTRDANGVTLDYNVSLVVSYNGPEKVAE